MTEREPYAVTLGGNLPKDPNDNGWIDLAEILCGPREVRRKIRYAIVAYDVNNVKDKTEDGSMQATVQLRRIEPIENEEQKRAVLSLLQTALEERTGTNRLSFMTTEPNGDDTPSAMDTLDPAVPPAKQRK